MSKRNPPSASSAIVEATGGGTTVPNYGEPIEDEAGNAFISRDFFLYVSPRKYDDEWAAATIKYHPYFKPSHYGDGGTTVMRNHRGLTRNIAEHKNAWLDLVRKDVFGNVFKENMVEGWNDGLAKLMSEEGSAGVGGNVINFTFQGRKPTSQNDVTNWLFGGGAVNNIIDEMIKAENYAEPFALLFKWGYYLSMEGGHSTWADTAVNKYIKTKNFKVTLSNNSSGRKNIHRHMWIRIATKLATNSFHQSLRNGQESRWKMKMLIGTTSKHTGPTVDVDIGEFLPPVVRAEMKRKGGTTFKVAMLDRTEEATSEDLLKMKLNELWSWGVGRGLTAEYIS